MALGPVPLGGGSPRPRSRLAGPVVMVSRRADGSAPPSVSTAGYSPRRDYHIVADRLHRQEMTAFQQTKPDERYKKGAIFPGPERARISWGKSHAGSGSLGDGPYSARGRCDSEYLYLHE